jgi:hypothetical protein
MVIKICRVILIALLLPGCANLKNSAQLAVGADITTTVVGVSSGLTELNPLITSPAMLAATGVARVVGIHYADKQEEPKRTETLSAIASVTWGIAASNAAIIATSSNPVGFIAGFLVAYATWKNTEPRRQAVQHCVVQPKICNP